MKKVVLRVDLHDVRNKQKILKSVSGISGIDIITMDTKDNTLTVIGDVNPLDVLGKLRKHWHIELVSVGPTEEPEKKKEEPKKDEQKKEEAKKDEPKKDKPKKEVPNEQSHVPANHDIPSHQLNTSAYVESGWKMKGRMPMTKPLENFSSCVDASKFSDVGDLEAMSPMAEEDKDRNEMEDLRSFVKYYDEEHLDAIATIVSFSHQKYANVKVKDSRVLRIQLSRRNVLVSRQVDENCNLFASRESNKMEVIQALMDNNINLVGVYGMGGIGKTTLVKQICREFEKTQLFDRVVLASISQNPDVRWIQTQIAEGLGIKIEGKMISARAKILSDELTNQEKNILIILDDIWMRLELAAVGIILGGDTYKVKVLITSRSLEVCHSMNTSKNINVNILSNKDSLELFHQEVRDLDFDAKRDMSVEIVNECHGLPLAIVALATILRRKDIVFWKAVILALKKSIYDGLDVVTSSIKRSYNYLQSNKTQLCFLLCALFPKDYKITVDALLGYGMGEGLFGGGGTLREARKNLHLMLGTLISFGLLLKCKEEGYVTMHHVVRDTALWIAREQRNESIIRAGLGIKKWPNVIASKSLRMSLADNDIDKVPDTPDCSQLVTLSLASNWSLKKIPDCFFEDMNHLGALDLSKTDISLFPQSLSSLKSCLRSLYLDDCKFIENISAIGNLVELEILSLQRTGILKLPEEVKGLINLKMLNLSGSKHLACIPPNVISCFYSLEELYMGASFSGWQIEDTGDKASLVEVGSLFQLAALHLDIENPKWLSTEMSLYHWRNLRTFCINLPSEEEEYDGINQICEKHLTLRIMPSKEEEYDDMSRIRQRQLSLKITSDSFPLANWVNSFIESTFDLVLRYCEGLENVLQLNSQGFKNLKSLTIGGSKTIEYIINLDEQVPEIIFPQLEILKLFFMVQLKAILNGPFTEKLFEKLKILRIEGCLRLVSVLPSQLWAKLQNLEEIEIVSCPRLKELGSNEYNEMEELTDEIRRYEVGNDSNIAISFPSLSILYLQNLSRLSRLFSDGSRSGHFVFECQFLRIIELRQCPNLKAFLFGIQSAPRIQKFTADDLKWFSQWLGWDHKAVKSHQNSS